MPLPSQKLGLGLGNRICYPLVKVKGGGEYGYGYTAQRNAAGYFVSFRYFTPKGANFSEYDMRVAFKSRKACNARAWRLYDQRCKAAGKVNKWPDPRLKKKAAPAHGFKKAAQTDASGTTWEINKGRED